ncbi:obscurin-like protein 1a isoform X4 [Pangasianodon hypophthalmus]|uniref:obscurin-like protein 1a isoform X4 n=1 Tax=Pangasianodon hypophthalmus TaxID=310915 RepID=UPI0023077E0B|nr:obscurin-like protein 1a isoform X4 [Pangasianodon hypophthalmus]
MDVFGGAPRVLGYPRSVLVKSGSDAVLKCQISGDPKPDVLWERLNEPIIPEGRYCITQDGNVCTLSIYQVTLEDAGQYICRAKNSIGDTYAAATLKVEEETQNVQMMYPLQEQQQIMVIPPKQEIKNLKQPLSDMEADLFQDNKPRFLIKPLSLRVDQGEDAAFSCKLWGNPLSEVVWEKDGKQVNEIYESSHFCISQQNEGWFQLKIFQTRAPDGGVYTCKAVNQYGEAVTGAVLLVESMPEQVGKNRRNGYTNGHSSPDQNDMHSKWKYSCEKDTYSRGKHLNVAKAKKFMITEGKHAKFRCYVTGKPKPEILWKKDGESIVPGRRHLVFEDREGHYTLKVLYCKQQDTGLYICTASNTLGNTLSAVQLSVKGPPVQFKRALHDMEVREKDVAILECEVPEESVPTVWYLEDQRLQPGSKYSMEQNGTRRRLTIQDVGADDDGVYVCEMPDGGKSIAELSVKGPIVKKLPHRMQVLEGENAAFCVEVDGEDMEVYWFKDGMQLQETHQTIIKSFGKTHILVFVNTSYQDSGTVTCMAGRSSTSCKLRIKAIRHCPPNCPVGVQMNADCQNGVVLSWSHSPNLQNSTKFMYQVEFQEIGSQEWERCFTTETGTLAEILGDSVPCEGDYRFRVCCVNKYGRSDHVEFPKSVHLVPGPKIKTPLKNTRVTEGEDAVFSIELSTAQIGTWFLNSTQLQRSENLCISQSKNIHTLRFCNVLSVYNGAEITFIASGVRDSAVLQVQAAVNKFIPLPNEDSNKRVQAGNPIVLYCEISNPIAAICWFKDGQELHQEEGLNIQADGNMRRIVIHSSEYFHSGVYTCQTDDDIITFNVNVEGPPVSFKEIPLEERHKSTMELDPVVLHCELSRPDATAHWFKDGIEVFQNDNVTIKAEGTMQWFIIRSANLSDSGTYTCQAGENTMSFTVTVKEPPVMIVEPKDDIHLDRYVSEEITLSCELSRSNGAACWFKDGLKVQGSENVRLSAEGPYRRLTIICASRRDSGEYLCDTGGDTVFFQLNVTEAPVHILSPSESEVEVCILRSERLVLSCEISKPEAKVCWYCDSMEVEESNNLILEEDGVHRRLVILQTTIDDSGEYVCETADDSVIFWVKIEEPPVKLSCSKMTGSDIQAFSGEAMILELEVSRENAEVCWMKNGMKVEESSNVTITVDGLIRKLSIHSPSLLDSGLYTCNAIDDTMDFQVNITEAPQKILKKDEMKTEYKVLLSDDIVLECELSRLNTVVRWYKDGSPIEENGHFCFEEEQAFRRLVILCAELEDSGEYLLDAKDDSISFHVTVEEPPVKILGNSDQTDYQEMVAGDDLILACEVSRANATIQWLYNGKPVVPDSRTYIENYGTLHKLIISDIQSTDSGKYVCDALDDQMVTTIKVQEPPVEFINKEETIMVTGYEAESITLTAVVSRPNAPVRWLKDWTLVSGERFSSTSQGLSHTFTIEPLKRSDSGEYTCDAITDELHFSLLVKEMRIKFVKPLFDTVAHRDGMITLRCEVCKSKADVQWLKDGAEITPSRRFSIRADGVERSLTIHRVAKEDAGEYACKSRDDRTSARVRVETRKITTNKGLMDIETFERETASFEVELSHTDVKGVWQKDGLRIKNSTTKRVSSSGHVHSLTLTNLTLEDTGTIVFSAEGLRTSAQLLVKETPVSLIKKLSDIRLEEGSLITLECELSRQNVDVKWLKNGLELKSDKGLRIYMMKRKHCLQIMESSVNDSGLYTCNIGDLCTSCKLEIYERQLEIVTALEDLYVNEEQNAVFMCEVSMENMSGDWYKNGQRIRPSSTIKTRQEGKKHFLLICNVTSEDAGEIKFVSKQVESVAYLEVQELPVSIVRPLRNRTALENHRVILECTVSSPHSEVSWHKGDIELESSEHMDIISEGCYHKLVIHRVAVEDEGTYRIEVGKHTSTAKLLVEAQSIKVLKELQDMEVSASEPAQFQCEVSVPLVKPPMWSLNGENLHPGADILVENKGTVYSITFKKTSLDMSGIVRFTTGKAKSSAKLKVI